MIVFMETILIICLALGLAASCGLRVFLPMLVGSIAARLDWLELSGNFVWMESTPAIAVFAIATCVEIGSSYVPWLDHLLDSISVPASVIAGIVVSAAAFGDLDPTLKWSVATIAGGGSAGTIKLGIAGLRLGSSVLTLGFGNPVISTFEWIGALFLSILAIVLPILAALIALLLLGFLLRFAVRFVSRRLQRKQAALEGQKHG